MPSAIIIVQTVTDWPAIVGIVTAGVLGPGLGYFAAMRSDRRRFRHERHLKAAGDLVALLDDVQVGLEKLGEGCAEMRNLALQRRRGRTRRTRGARRTRRLPERKSVGRAAQYATTCA